MLSLAFALRNATPKDSLSSPSWRSHDCPSKKEHLGLALHESPVMDVGHEGQVKGNLGSSAFSHLKDFPTKGPGLHLEKKSPLFARFPYDPNRRTAQAGAQRFCF